MVTPLLSLSVGDSDCEVGVFNQWLGYGNQRESWLSLRVAVLTCVASRTVGNQQPELGLCNSIIVASCHLFFLFSLAFLIIVLYYRCQTTATGNVCFRFEATDPRFAHNVSELPLLNHACQPFICQVARLHGRVQLPRK